MQESILEEELTIEDDQGSQLYPAQPENIDPITESTTMTEQAPIEPPQEIVAMQEQITISDTDTKVDSEKLLEILNQVVATIQKQATSMPVPKVEDQYATALHHIKNQQDHYQGARWFRKAAMRGHAKSQFYLGVLFAKGQGVPQSLFHAYSWLTLASCQNLPEADESLKKIEPHLTAKMIQQALKLAAERFEQIEAQLN